MTFASTVSKLFRPNDANNRPQQTYRPNDDSLAADPSESANNPRAQNYLGALFYEGRGVAKDLTEAVKWFRRGARQGNAQACQNLGVCYQAGLGVSKDIPKAVELFRQAVEGGRCEKEVMVGVGQGASV